MCEDCLPLPVGVVIAMYEWTEIGIGAGACSAPVGPVGVDHVPEMHTRTEWLSGDASRERALSCERGVELCTDRASRFVLSLPDYVDVYDAMSTIYE